MHKHCKRFANSGFAVQMKFLRRLHFLPLYFSHSNVMPLLHAAMTPIHVTQRTPAWKARILPVWFAAQFWLHSGSALEQDAFTHPPLPHTNTRTHTHTHAYTRTHARTYTHTHKPWPSLSLWTRGFLHCKRSVIAAVRHVLEAE
jgi:hypothetical protein